MISVPEKLKGKLETLLFQFLKEPGLGYLNEVRTPFAGLRGRRFDTAYVVHV